MSIYAPRARRPLWGESKVRGTLALAVVALLFAGPQLIGEAAPGFQTTPGLGRADSFAILASTYTNTVGGTTINGDLGYTTGPAVAPTVNGSTFSPPNPKYTGAGIDQGTALAALNAQACTFNFAAGAVDLATDATHGAVGIYGPGVYCVTGAATVGAGGITLTGAGTYIFRMTGALGTVANSAVSVAGGASACNVFWTPGGATTLGANSTFRGTDIDDAGITIGNTVTWIGRALAFGGTISTDSDTITASSCSLAATVTPVPPGPGLASNDGGNEPATAVPPATRTATPTATFTSTPTATATTVPATATLIPATATSIPSTATSVPSIPTVVVLAEVIVPAPLPMDEMLTEVPEELVEIPVPLVPEAPQPQIPTPAPAPASTATPTPRPAPPVVSFPNTGGGPAPILLPTTGGASGAAVTGALMLAGAAVSLAGTRWAMRRVLRRPGFTPRAASPLRPAARGSTPAPGASG